MSLSENWEGRIDCSNLGLPMSEIVVSVGEFLMPPERQKVASAVELAPGNWLDQVELSVVNMDMLDGEMGWE